MSKLVLTFSPQTYLVPDRKILLTAPRAAVCGEAAHLPLPAAAAKQTRTGLPAAVLPSDESHPEAADLPSLIIDRLPAAKQLPLRENASRRYKAHLRPLLTSNI